MKRNWLAYIVTVLASGYLQTAKAQIGQDAAVMLLHPAHGDTLPELYPSFTWAPALTQTGTQPLYQLRLVEVMGNQTPEAAIQQNPDVWRVANLRTAVYPYSVAAPLLGKNKKYAWQVTTQYTYAVASQEQVATKSRLAQSEVFAFVINDDMSDENCTPTLYKRLDSRFYVFDETLAFRLPAEAEGQIKEFRFDILDARSKAVQEGVPVKEQAGAGKYTVALDRYETFRKKATRHRFYVLKASNAAGEVYQLKFTTR